MEKISNLNQLQVILSSAQSIFIFLSPALNKDKVAAAVSLFLSLKKAGKQVSVFCPQSLTVEYSYLVGVDEIKNKIEGKGLIISFPKEVIEKVSYNEGEDKLELIIRTKEGYPSLTPDQLTFSSAEVSTDVILTIGIEDFSQVESFSRSFPNLLGEKEKIKVLNPQNFQASGWSEIIANFLGLNQWPFDEDIGTNLLVGLEEATGSFGPQAGIGAFEAATFCLKAGGKRMVKEAPQSGASSSQTKKKEKFPSPDWFTPKIYKGDTIV